MLLRFTSTKEAILSSRLVTARPKENNREKITAKIKFSS